MATSKLFAGVLVLVLALPMTAAGSLSSLIIDLSKEGARGVPSGWKLLCSDRSTTCYFVEEDDVSGFCIRTDDSKNSVQRKVDVDIREFPVITWRWKVKELPANGDCRSCDTDDQAAQLYIVFEGKDVLGYIWDTNAPVGEGADYSIPLFQDVKTLVVKSGHEGKGEWVTLTRNVREDYEAMFGKEPPGKVIGIRFQANSQHTGSIAEACIEKIQFTRGG